MTLQGTYDYGDEWILDNPQMRSFIGKVNDIRGSAAGPRQAVEQIRSYFEPLLHDHRWLPQRFQEPAEESGMGGGIGMWLLYRAGDGGLAFSALVVPPGEQTPIHNHLAWGLVGLFRGEQAEEVYRRQDDATDDGVAELELAEERLLKPGDFYELLPEIDIHRVRTTSEETSVSLHLLGNDNGCIWRHRFEPDAHAVSLFKSGWINVECREYSSVPGQP